MSDAPTGTVTFLFTDIEGSVKLWESNPEHMQCALVRHDEILQSKIVAYGGFVFKTMGDAFCAAFPTASYALAAALSAQKALRAQE
jgi:class 3 adenylate cyclase